METHYSQLPIIPQAKGLSIDETFLLAARILGFTEGDEIHRRELFPFIQVNMTNSLEESLQGTIEKSEFWTRRGAGVYALNNKGYTRMMKTFRDNIQEQPRVLLYKISRKYKGKTFKVHIDTKSKTITTFIDEEEVPTRVAINLLDSFNAHFRVNSNSSTSKIWNWIVQDKDYYWETLTSDSGATEIKKKPLREMNISGQKYWIFQANPDLYDLESAIKEFREISFLVNQHVAEIGIGDIVFLWESGPKAGIIALASILTNPTMMPENIYEKKYTLKDEKFTGYKMRVQIRIDKILEQRLNKEKIQSVPPLKNISILKSAQGSNFPLTKEEGDTLYSIIHEIGDGNRITEPEPTPQYTYENLLIDIGVERQVLDGWLNAIERKKQVIFYGPPGTGKTFTARKIAKYLASKHEGIVDIVQFHPAFAYEDFIQGIRPKTTSDGGLDYSLVNGRFLDFCDKASENGKISVLIIDEINRADLSRVFGELMYLLEYRDEEVALASGKTMSIPDNVRIIGTMNTADRSIALVDHALRRRFAFLRLFPDYELLRRYHYGSGFNPEGLIQVLSKVNKEIGDNNYSIGVSFFMVPNIRKNIEAIWKLEIEPYLEEFFFDDQERVDSFRWENVSEKIS